MKHLKNSKLIMGVFIFIITALISTAYCANEEITVIIDYGGLQQGREVKVRWKQGLTALEALQSVARIETRQIDEYILVTSIDNTEGQIGKMVWYHDINGKRANTFANKYILSEWDSMKWSYSKDVCSPDKK